MPTIFFHALPAVLVLIAIVVMITLGRIDTKLFEELLHAREPQYLTPEELATLSPTEINDYFAYLTNALQDKEMADQLAFAMRMFGALRLKWRARRNGEEWPPKYPRFLPKPVLRSKLTIVQGCGTGAERPFH